MKRFLGFICAIVLILGVVKVSNATNLQLHSPVDIDDVAYIFTLWNLPVGGGTVDLKGCKWKNIPIPWYATDAHHIVGMGITSKHCKQAIGAFEEDTPGHFVMNKIDDFFISTGEDIITFPWLISYTEDIYYGIDLRAYYDNGGTSYNLGDTFCFVDGTDTNLPGFIVGTSEIYWDDTVGWKSDNPFTGSLSVAGEGGICVPVPSTCLLFLFGILGMVGVKKKFS